MRLRNHLFIIIVCLFAVKAKAQGKYGGGVGDGYASQEFSNSITSVKVTEAPTLKVFPNPAVDYLQIESTEPVRNFVLLDSKGRTVLKMDYVLEKINVRNLSPGIYYLRVGSKVRKLIKQ